MRTVMTMTGILIGVAGGAAILLSTRYQLGGASDPNMFTRFDLWTGHLEYCSSYFDDKTYCGNALETRVQQWNEVNSQLAHRRFRDYGYSEEQIEAWPSQLLSRARNLVTNGGSKSELDRLIRETN